jgi:L-2,4-diaminobutyrate decarboxylase
LVEHCCATAHAVAAAVRARPSLELWRPPTLSTVLFRPRGADDRLVAALRRQLLMEGTAVLGRATAPDADGHERLWLKLTLLHPTATSEVYEPLLDLVAARGAAVVDELDKSGVLV